MGRASHVEDDGLLHFKEAYESCKKDEDQPLTRAKKSPPGRGSRAAAGGLPLTNLEGSSGTRG